MNEARGGVARHVHTYDTIVVGSDLNAIIFSYINGYVFINNHYSEPPYFDTLDLSDLAAISDLYDDIYEKMDPKTGEISKEKVRNYISVLLSMRGLQPFSDKTKSIRIRDNSLKVFTHDSKMIECKFDNLFIFDDLHVEDIPFDYKKKDAKYRVLDWYKVESGALHPHEQICGDDDFVNKIHFYPSIYNPLLKHMVSVSFLTKEQLQDPEYSEIYMRYKIIDMLTDAGIRGRKNGLGIGGKQNRLSLKISFQKRDLEDLTILPYIEEGCITMDNRSIKEIVEQHKRNIV